MSSKLAALLRTNLLGLIAIFIALAGTAYAANEWTGDNIVDGSLTTADYKNNDVRSADLLNAGIKADDLAPDAIPSDEGCGFPTICFSSSKIADRAVGESEISPGAVGTSEVAPNSLTGSDVNEAALDSAVLQRRVGGGCAVGDSIRAISAGGGVTCNSGPAGFSVAADDTGQICDVNCTELTLRSIPAGTYLIVAKIWITQEAPEVTSMICELVAGADTDQAAVQDFDDDSTVATLPMQLVHTFGSTANASINCHDNGIGNVDGQQAKIAAIRLGSLNGG
jgi:hypothetical protein